MAAAARSLRIGICNCSRIAARLQNVSPTTVPRRFKSASSIGRTIIKRDEVEIHPYEGFQFQRDEDVEAAYNESVAGLSEEEKAAQEAEAEKAIARLAQHPAMRKLEEEVGLEIKRGARISKRAREDFWNDGELDPDLIENSPAEETFDENEITSMAHAKLQEHREHRAYARLAVWEMPLLAKFAKPFVPPTQDQVLRFRYTSYMGEWHPAERKVVLEFCPRDLPLSEAEQLKLKKLVGARYNPQKDVVHMSCDMYENQAQNKRYLGDLVDKLIAEARDHTDMFEDIPLDTRHHPAKKKLRFPDEWKLTEERRKELAELWSHAQLLDESKRTEGSLIDGVASIQHQLPPPAMTSDRVRVPVRVAESRQENHGLWN